MSYVPHLITLILIIAVVVFATINLFYVNKAHKTPFLHFLLYTVCILQIMTMAAFTVNQAAWVMLGHEEVVGSLSQIGWLAYDYLNKLCHLIAAVALNFYLRFKHAHPQEASRRKATDD